jgi:energy-coupling factor transporter ATP-binding protein EcfA2
MQIKKLRVTNVASLVNFHNDSDFQKYNIIFGTNGSGKSTLVELLHLINKYCLRKDAETEIELKDFLRGRFSKESISDTINIELYINSNKVFITYNKNSDSLKFSTNIWAPIKVFNEQYTDRTMGKKFETGLQNSSITIGEKNIELEKAYSQKRGLEEQSEKYISKANEIVEATIEKYKAFTKSSTNVSDKIFIQTLLDGKCDFQYDPTLLEKRNKLGFGNVETSLTKLDEYHLTVNIDIDSIEKSCNEKISPPVISGDIETLLKKYTDFYNKGLEIYENNKKEVCPFCQRDWPHAEEMITKYKSFIKSTYNQKRKAILDAIDQLERYKLQVENYIYVVDGRRKLTEEEAKKYNVDTKNWKPLQYYKEKHNEIIDILRKKHDQMDLQVSVKNQIIELQNYHLDIIQNNNGIIDKVLREISAISSRRRELNRKLVDHFAKVHISDTYGHCFRKHPDSDFGIIRTLISAHPDTLSKD